MKQLTLYLQSALYNIRHNKAYAIFCIGGTALTFVFITIILQLTSIVNYNTAPAVNADRTVTISCWDKDRQGRQIINLNEAGIHNFMKYVKDYEYYSFRQTQPIGLVINGILRSNIVNFVNADFWKVYQFNFLEGRPFTAEEEHTPVVVITESVAKHYFKNGSAINQTIEFQKNTYKVIGIIADFSILSVNASAILAPYTYNQFYPNRTDMYDLEIVFSKTRTPQQMTQHVVDALRLYNTNRSCDIDITTDTYKTNLQTRVGWWFEGMFIYGIGFILFVLLIIPAVNILTLSVANVSSRAEEISIRRALGAGITSSFFQILLENLILVLTGTLVGLLLVYPVFHSINDLFSKSSILMGTALLPDLNVKIVLLGVLPLSILFSLLSGGIPAYRISKQNIAETLKGDSK